MEWDDLANAISVCQIAYNSGRLMCGLVGAASINGRYFASHWTEISGKLAAMMNGMGEHELQIAQRGFVESVEWNLFQELLAS